MVTITDEGSTAKFEAVLETFTSKIKKRKAIKASLRNKCIKDIQSFKGVLKVVSGKFVLAPEFYAHIVKSNNLDKKTQDENKAWRKLFQECSKHSLIHKSSSYFPQGLSIVSINPNVPSLATVGYSHADNYMASQAVLYDGADELTLSDKNKLAYRDLKLYQMMPLSSGELERVNLEDSIFLDKETVLIYVEHASIVRTTIPIYTLIKVTGLELVSILNENLSLGIKFPFSSARGAVTADDTGSKLKQDFAKYKKEKYGSLHISALNMTARNIAIFSSSPVQAVISYNRTVVSKLTISEVNVLYPNAVPKHLLKQETERVLFALARPDTDKESSENEEPSFSIKDLDKLQDLLKIKTNSEFRKKIASVVSELKKYLTDADSIAHGRLIVEYIMWLLERVEKRNKIAVSTFKGYLGLLNKHLFTKVEDLSQLQPSELDIIIDGLFRLQYKGKSIRKIRALIMLFFKHHKQNHRMAHIDTSSVPKSLIFKGELNQALAYISKNLGKGAIRQGKHSQFYVLELQALVILAFYTGLRKSELRSRLLEDISLYGCKLYVDVNSSGLKMLHLKLKTSNAKRRVGAVIEDAEHLQILHDFFTMREKVGNKSKFLFLQVKQTEVLVDDVIHVKYAVKSKALPEIEFDEVTAILQSLTGRYVTFHSFRHSYATYEVKRIIENPSADPHQLIDLAVRMGHESPETTLKIYAHRSVIDLGGV